MPAGTASPEVSAVSGFIHKGTPVTLAITPLVEIFHTILVPYNGPSRSLDLS